MNPAEWKREHYAAVVVAAAVAVGLTYWFFKSHPSSSSPTMCAMAGPAGAVGVGAAT